MEQHSVPQHIASFEFKLFGNLTVRQFVTLSIPMALAAIIFYSSLPPLVRLPLSGVLAILAFFAALVPVGGRPLDRWLVVFIKAVLSPTQRIWVKESRIPQFLKVVVAPPSVEEHIPEEITAASRERLREYLRSLPKGEIGPLDLREQLALLRLGLGEGQVGGQAVGETGVLPAPIIWPTTRVQETWEPLYPRSAGLPAAEAPWPQEEIGEQIRELPKSTEEGEDIGEEVVKISAHAKPYALPGLLPRLKKEGPTIRAKLASEANFTIENVIPIKMPNSEVRLIHGVGQTRVRKLHFAPPVGFDLSKLPIRGEKRFEISQELKRRFEPLVDLLTGVEETQRPAVAAAGGVPTVLAPGAKEPARGVVRVPKMKRAVKKAFGVSLAPDKGEILDSKIRVGGQPGASIAPLGVLATASILPLTNKPNVISGVVTTADGKPLENVILVVRDAGGIPVRAMKTSKLGQFLSATSLANGIYTIELEDEMGKFKPLQINLQGEVLSPLAIYPVK